MIYRTQYKPAVNKNKSLKVKLHKLWCHKLNIGKWRGEVEGWIDEGIVMAGYRCHKCDELEGIHEAHRRWPRPGSLGSWYSKCVSTNWGRSLGID